MRISGGTGVTMIKGMTMLGGRAIIRTGTSKRKKMIPVVKLFYCGLVQWGISILEFLT